MGEEAQTSERAAGHVFLSYARADRERVRPIVDALEAAGRQVWWDYQLVGGAAFAREIETALRSAEAVIVVWSRASVISDWVRDEAMVGLELHKLVPVRLDDVAAPLGFGQYHSIDLTGWNGRPQSPAFGQLVQALQAEKRTPEPSPARLARTPPVSRRLALGAAALAVPLAVGGAWWLGRRRLAGLAKAPPLSIAVLPFTNLGGDAAQDYFSDGLSDELIGALARLPSLQVTGRTSSFKYKGSRETSAAIAAKLGVAYLLDGSVRRAGDRVRISAELIEARTGFERWTKTFDQQIKDVLTAQTLIAEAVASELRGTLIGGAVASITSGGTSSPAAYDAYLKGLRLFDLNGGVDLYRAALADFDAAIAADPGFATAHAARARALLTISDNFSGLAAHKALFTDALTSARRAVDIAPDLAEAQATLADTLASGFLDFAGARRAYARAMATGGGEADILSRFGQFSCAVGDFETGLDAARRAPILDPLNPGAFVSLGWALVAARRYDEGIAAVRQALALSPGTTDAHAIIGAARLFTGDVKGAIAEYVLEPVDSLRQAGLAIARHRLGDLKGAQVALHALVSAPDQVAFYQQAEVYVQWGQIDRAFAALDAAVGAVDDGLMNLNTDQMFDPIRRDPRLAALTRRLGLSA